MGTPLAATGRKVLRCGFQAGSDKKLEFLSMPVNRVLGSVSQMVEAGCRVVFDAEDRGGSYVIHRPTGERHRLHQRRGVFVLPLWVRPPGSGFPGPVQKP